MCMVHIIYPHGPLPFTLVFFLSYSDLITSTFLTSNLPACVLYFRNCQVLFICSCNLQVQNFFWTYLLIDISLYSSIISLFICIFSYSSSICKTIFLNQVWHIFPCNSSTWYAEAGGLQIPGPVRSCLLFVCYPFS